MQWKALVVALLLGATFAEPVWLEAQSAAAVIPAPPGPHVIISVPVQLVNVPKETSSVGIFCTLVNLTGAELTPGKWIELPIQSPTPNGSGIDWSATASVEFTIPGTTLGDLQKYNKFMCDITLKFSSIGAFYGSVSKGRDKYTPGLKPVDIPLGANAPQQRFVMGTITW